MFCPTDPCWRGVQNFLRLKRLVADLSLGRHSLPPNDFQKIEAAYNAARERYQM
jgi:hypothetical protein